MTRSAVSDTAHLEGSIDIFYSDSGAPPNSTDYTTVVILHGSAFTGNNMKKLHNYAHSLNLRTVIWNRRNYAGSTKYTEDELDEIKHGRRIFLDRMGAELAQFLLLFIKKYNVPRVSADRKTGGFAIMGWSMGNTTALSLFSHTSLLPPEDYKLLEPYVKDLIIYDATLLAFGWKLPSDADATVIYEPISKFNTDTPGTPEEMARSFHAWLSSYYDHPKDPKSVNDLHFAERAERATSDSWSAEDLNAFHDYGAFVRSELPMYRPPMQLAIGEFSERALGDGSVLMFPNCPVIYLRPTRTTWRCYWFGIQAKRRYDELLRDGKHVRASMFLPIEGGNHFAHWDMPLEVMQAVALSIRGGFS